MDIPPWAPTLTSGVVTLRPHRDPDVDAILAQCQDPDMVRWTTIPQPYARRDAVEFVAGREPAWTEGRCLTLAVTVRDTDTATERYAGAVELTPQGEVSAELGYGLAPWARGRGICATAVRTLLGWGFGELGLEVVHWRAVTGNWASRRVAWAVGFRIEGTVRGLVDQRGTARDGWIGSLRRGDPMVPDRPWYDPPTIIAGPVVLREGGDADTDRVVEALNDPETARRLPDLPIPVARDDVRRGRDETLAAHAAGQRLTWTIADARDDRPFGEITLFGLDGPDRSAEVGFWTHPDARGRGIARASVRAAVRHAVLPVTDGGLGLDRVVLRTAVDNLPARAVAKASGFREVGRERRAARLRDGTTQDLVRYDLLPEEVGPPDGTDLSDGSTSNGSTGGAAS